MSDLDRTGRALHVASVVCAIAALVAWVVLL